MFRTPLKYSILIFIVTILSFTWGCKGISGSGVSETERFESGFRSLRLGQITAANDRVATTMAIDSRETIVVIEPAPGSPSLTEVLYQTSDGLNNAQILVGSNSLPEQVNTEDSKVIFSNYTNSNVTLDITNNGSALPSRTVPLDSDIFGFFNLNKSLRHTKAFSNSDLSRLFKIATVAVRVFGCSSKAYLASSSSSPAFGSLTDTACSSVLVTTMLNVIKVNDFDQRIVDGFTGNPTGCAYTGGSFLDAVNCLNGSKPEVITESLISSPEIETVLDGTFNPDTGEIIPPTPEPTATPDNTTTPEPTATPDNTIPDLPDAPVPEDPIPDDPVLE